MATGKIKATTTGVISQPNHRLTKGSDKKCDIHDIMIMWTLLLVEVSGRSKSTKVKLLLRENEIILPGYHNFVLEAKLKEKLSKC